MIVFNGKRGTGMRCERLLAFSTVVWFVYVNHTEILMSKNKEVVPLNVSDKAAWVSFMYCVAQIAVVTLILLL